MMRERSPKPVRVVLALTGGALVLIAPSGCASSGKAQNRASEQRARELGLSSDALDPTLRDKRDGYGRWKQKPDPEGTDSPMSPDRRRWAEQP